MAEPPPLPPLPPAIGLDLGMSYSRAAVLSQGAEQPKTIKDERGNSNFPTYVGFSSDPDSAVVLVGKEARDLSALHPTNTAIGFKRLLGRTVTDPRVVNDERYLPIELVPDEKTQLAAIRVKCKGIPTNYSPEQLMTTLTEKIVENAFNSLGMPVRDAVVTVPSCFNLLQRKLVHQFCEEAGLNVLCTVNEATAAGLAHCIEKQATFANSTKERNILVVNLGAGYLSVVVMGALGTTYEVKSISGTCDVSGSEVDHVLVDYYLQELKKKIGHDIPRNKPFIRTLRLAAAAAKRKLSTSNKATITFQLYNCEVGISREKLEDLCGDIFKALMDEIEGALRSCNSGRLGINQVDDILLVGEGSSVPKIQELIRHFFNGKELQLLSSESAAHGSALLAAVLQNRTYQVPSISSVILKTTLPSSISIEAPTGLVTTVITKNAKLPAKETVKVTTITENQKQVVVSFYEGESPVTRDNLYLGQVVLMIAAAPRGMPKISVTVEVQWDGSVSVMVEEEMSCSKAELDISIETMMSTRIQDPSSGVVACEEAVHSNITATSVRQGKDVYYFLPPDAVAPSPPLIPRRVSKSYENIKLKGQEPIDPPTTAMTSISMGSHPPTIPPRKGYENVELKESKKKKTEEEEERGRGKEGIVMATSPGVNPPVPLKRARSPQPPKELCPITPPVPARRSGREKKAAAGAAENSKKTKLFKVTSMPYCPVSPDDSSPQLPAREKNRSVSNPVSLPLEVENDDSSNCDKPSPYYSLPPDSLSPMAEIDARFHIDDSDEGEEGGLETYLTLGEEIQSKARSGSGTEEKAMKSPVQYCPPLPPKPEDTPAVPVSSVIIGIAESTATTTTAASTSSGEFQHLKERLLETELRMKFFEQQVTEREEEIETLTNLLSDTEEKLNMERTRAEIAERERASYEERTEEAERRAEEARDELQNSLQSSRLQPDSSSGDQALQKFDQHQFWVVTNEEIEFTEEEIGRGGWGVVKVAEFRGLRCAAKRMHKLIISDYNRHLFVREMTIAARVRHPNLVQFIGATMEKEPIILMELMACSLRSVLEKKPLNPTQILSIGLDVARALNYLHLMRPDPVIHRDISSANVLLNPSLNNQWIAKLSDYGSANFVRSTLTAGPGNPTYAAPEANSPSKQGPKMDVYSYGVLLLEMCTRKFPDPKSIDNEALLKKIQSRSQLAPVIRQCLQILPDDRPSMKDVIARLSV